MLAGGQILRLGTHILDLGQLQRPVFLGLGQGLAGYVGVDMNLKGGVVLTNDQTVANGIQIAAQRFQVHILPVLADDIHGVEGKGDILHGQGLKVGLIPGALLLLHHLRHGQSPELIQQTDPVGFTHRPAPERSG